MEFQYIIKEMSENEKIVLGLMDSEFGKYYIDLQEALPALKKSELKKIVKNLKGRGLILVGSLVDLNGDRRGYFGRGWTLTGIGERLRDSLDEKYFI